MVYEILLPGEQNAQSSRDICRILGITTRQLTQAVEAERRAGKPICASCSRRTPGYYLAETQQEMQDYCGKLKHRAGEIFATRRACMATIESLPAEEA